MKHNKKVTRVIEAAAGLERLKHLEDQLASAPSDRRTRHALSMAIRVEAEAYRKSLDTEQANAKHDPRPQLAVGLGSLHRPSTSPKPTLAFRRRTRIP